MFNRLRGWLLKVPVLVALGLIGFYFLFGYLLFPPLAKWGAAKYVARKSGHVLALGEAQFDPLRLTLTLRDLKLTEPHGKPLLSFEELFVDFESRSVIDWASTFADIRLRGPVAQVELRPDGRLNWTAFLDAFRDEEEKPSKPLPRLRIAHMALERGRVEFDDQKVAGGFKTVVTPLTFRLSDLSTLPDDKGAYALSARSQAGTRIRWRGQLALNPVKAKGELALDEVPLSEFWNYVDGRYAVAPPEGKGALRLHYGVGYVDKHFSLALENVELKLAAFRLRGQEAANPAVALDSITLSGGRLDLDKRQVTIARVVLGGGHVELARRADGSIDVLDWFKPKPTAGKAGQPLKTQEASPAPAKAKEVAPTNDKPATGDAPWQFTLDRFSLDGVGIKVSDGGFVTPLRAEVGNLKIGCKAAAAIGAGEPLVNIDDIGVEVGDLRLFSANQRQPLFALETVALTGGKLDVAQRRIGVARLAFRNGETTLRRDHTGEFPLLKALAHHSVPVPAEVEKSVHRESAGQAWRYGVEVVELSGFKVSVRDESVRPALALDFKDLGAELGKVSDDMGGALPFRLSLGVAQGGKLEAQGELIPAKPAADVRVNLSGLSLLPAQPYIARAAKLSLASGRVFAAGRLRYDKSVRYDGDFQVKDLLLNEAESGKRFLGWRSLGSTVLKVTPESVDVGTLKVDGLGAKLVIHEDKSVNLKRILKPAPVEKTDGSAESASKTAVKGGPGFRVAIDTIKVTNGEMDFADYSLALPFGTRIHQLRGHMNGVSSRQGGPPARLEFDGLVDEYGMARATGQLNLFDPTGFMDIKTVFRNVEMTNLTPYSATFAGRKIASGKLSLDLEYKIKNRQLVGENQVIMDRLTLGERVESPTAKSLPLDLAIAVLSDADGRIDLGLPVSGSLDDPEFSYGRIIWKAIVNVITKVVTAPFRLLGKLLGVESDKLERLAFDPGSAELLPPERETLKNLALALEKRPRLALTVKGTWDPVADRFRIKERRLRVAVAKGMGLTLNGGEEAPPVATGNGKVGDVLETLCGQRLGKVALKRLKSAYYLANPDKRDAAAKMVARLSGLLEKEEPAPAEQLAALKGKEFAAVMYEQLLDHEVVTDAELMALAGQRGRAIVHELQVVNKVAAERLTLEEPEAVEGDGKSVAVKIGAGVARGTVAPASEEAPRPAGTK